MKFNVSRLFSLNVILTIPFVIQLIIVIGGISWLSAQSTRQVVNHLTLLLLEKVGDRLQSEIDQMLARPITITQEHQDLIDLGILDLDNLEPWAPYIYKQYLNYQEGSLTGFLVCDRSGAFRSAGHTYDQQGKKIQGLGRATPKIGYKYYAYQSIQDYIANRNEKLVLDYFDCTKRPWYINTVKTQKPQWTTLFTRQIYQKSLAINFSRPLYSPDRSQLLGVTSVQLSLQVLNQFLEALKIGQSGSAFIVDQQGYLIADSTGLSQIKIINQKAEPILSKDSTNPVIQTISRDLLSFNLEKPERQYFPDFKINNQGYFVLTLPLKQHNGLNWLAVIVIPQADFFNTIWQNQRLTFILSTTALLIAIILGLISAYFITQPITRLSQATLELAKGNWQKPIELSVIKELKVLAQGFQQMANQLQDFVKKIQNQEQQLRQFLGVMPIGVTVYNVHNQQVYINERGKTLFHTQLNHLQEKIQLTLQGESFYLDDINLEINANNNIILELWMKPIIDDDNHIVFAIMIAQDITDRKQAEKLLKNYNQTLIKAVEKQTQALVVAKKKAEVANEAKSLLLTNMSHELKTPLHAILGFTALVLNDPACSSTFTQSLTIVRKNAIHLLTLITNLLDLAKIEAGKLILTPQSVNLMDFLKEIEEIFQLSAQTKKLDFSVNWLTPCPQVIRVDVTKLRQILFNLLSNAFKFTPLGSVSITVACYPLAEDKAQLRFWIADTGIGISEAEKDKLFHAFYRGEKFPFLIEGTGLGLALTQQYIQFLGGEITIESEPQKGTCIHFHLPIAILSHPKAQVAQPKVEQLKNSPLTSLQIAQTIKCLPLSWCHAFYDALMVLDEPTMLRLLSRST
ncbi:MAG: ATP-binding protein [Snowella sp.]|nr:ATP-binding protein [Snowella sp.]